MSPRSREPARLQWATAGPATPTATLYNYYYGNPTYNPPETLTTDTTYRWQVTARNQVGTAPAAEWTFTTETLPDLELEFGYLSIEKRGQAKVRERAEKNRIEKAC